MAYDMTRHFNPVAKEVTFLLGDREVRQAATLVVLMRVEAKFGPAMPLISRLVAHQVTVADLIALLRLILAGKPDLPKGETRWAEAIAPFGTLETAGAIVAFLSYAVAGVHPPQAAEAVEAPATDSADDAAQAEAAA